MPKVLVALDGEIAMFERKLLKRLKPGKDLVNALIRHYKKSLIVALLKCGYSS